MRDYFRGWYIKCQNGRQTVAFIPAWHITKGERSCSLQIITGERAWNISYPYERFLMDRNGVTIGSSSFTKQGARLDIQEDALTVRGNITFGKFSPIAYDIMGPFRYVPFMECRHSVFSMKHRVDGQLTINGEEFTFDDGVCYIEGDRGHSFPSEYAWTQCCFPEGSLMLSVADIPLGGIHFTGVISVIHYRGRECRLATYLGACAEKIHDGEVIILQGKKQLTVKRLEAEGHALAAPVGGSMKRTIRESAACRAYYHYQEDGKTIFEFVSDQAAFEYEYPQ